MLYILYVCIYIYMCIECLCVYISFYIIYGIQSFWEYNGYTVLAIYFQIS